MFEIRPILSALSRHKSSTLLIVLQIAITFAVVVNSINIINQRLAMMQRESGFNESQLMAVNVNAYSENYDRENNILADIQLLRNTPGVIDAVALNQIPISGSGSARSMATSQENFDNLKKVTAGVFRGDSHTLNTLGIELIEGRNFNPDEVLYDDGSLTEKVVLITKSLADKLYPKESALGKLLYFGSTEAQVIGIVDHMSGPWVHTPFFLDNMIFPDRSGNRILVRTETNARDEILGNIEKLLLDRNPERVISQIRSFDEVKERSYRGDDAMTKILWVVICLLILITAFGIVGIVSFNVNQRLKQIGTRRALGARKIDIHRYFITENILITLLGLIIGTGLAISFNIYLVENFDISPINWYYIPTGMLTMLAIGILSVWMPAQKAAGISPAIATQNI